MNSDWSEASIAAWLDAQRQYWDNLAQAASNNHSSLDSLWQQLASLSAKAPPTINNVLERVTEMGRIYTGLAEQILKNTDATADFKPSIEDGMAIIEASLAQWLKKEQADAMGSEALMAGLTLTENWAQLFASQPDFSQLGGEQAPYLKMLSAFKPQDAANWQIQLQNLSELSSQYQTALNEYLNALSRQNVVAMRRLRERLQAMMADGQSIHSLRELLDLWVDTCAASYHDFALSDEYQVVYGDLTNAAMALKQAAHQLQEEQLRTFNSPTQTDIKAILQQQQSMRREQRALQRRIQHLEQQLAQVLEQTPNKEKL